MTDNKATFRVKEGVTLELEFLFHDADGAPIDLTGCTARAQVRETPDGALVHDFAAEGRIAVRGPEGIIAITITPADSLKFKRRLMCDLLIDWPVAEGQPTRTTAEAELTFLPEGTTTKAP